MLLTWLEGGGLVPYLTQIADKLRVKLTLMVEVVDTAYGGKLVRYYEKNGFEIKKSDFDDDFDFMTMEPDPSDELKGQVYMERKPYAKPTLGEGAAALNEAATITWQKSPDAWVGEFQTARDRWFSVRISKLNHEAGWAFEFSEVPQHVLWLTGRAEKPDMADFDHANPVGSLAPTGRGEAFAVYTALKQAMLDFLRDEQPERVRFKGATGRQTRLYRTMLKHYRIDLAQLGYRASGAALVRLT